MAVCQAGPMPAMTTTSFAVLGLLSVRPWSAYELAKQTERSLSWFWPRTERKIYDEAKRLVDDGYATAERTTTGRRHRTEYSITESGRAALADWLGEPSAPVKLEAEALVRVFFADGGSLEQLRATLRELRFGTEQRLRILRDMIDAIDPDDAFAERRPINALGLRFQLDHHRAIRDWCEWALEQTATWSSPTDAGDWEWRQALS